MSRFRHDKCGPGSNDIRCNECEYWHDQNESYCPHCGYSERLSQEEVEAAEAEQQENDNE